MQVKVLLLDFLLLKSKYFDLFQQLLKLISFFRQLLYQGETELVLQISFPELFIIINLLIELRQQQFLSNFQCTPDEQILNKSSSQGDDLSELAIVLAFSSLNFNSLSSSFSCESYFQQFSSSNFPKSIQLINNQYLDLDYPNNSNKTMASSQETQYFLHSIILKLIQVSKMNAQTLKYLQKDEIGKVIATGLATLYINKPEKPVQYLAEWLKNYSFNQKEMDLLLKAEHAKLESFKQYQKQVEIKTKQETEKKNQQQKVFKTINEFKSMVAQCQYFDDLLPETLPQFLQKNTRATGVYIVEYNYPQKDVKQEDTQQLAHLNTSVDKVLNYIGTSISHKSLLRGKQLPTNKGVTFKSFQLLQPQGPPVVGEDGQQIAQTPKAKYVFVGDVVKNQSMHYFKIPKLGSYLAVPIECNQYLTESNFDVSLKQKLEYLKQVEQFQKTKRNEIQELQKEKVDFEKRIAELIQKNAEKDQIQPLEVELKDVNDAIQEKQEQKIQQKQPTLTSEKRSIVVCSDTLGKDIQFSEKQINFIVEITYHLKDSWQMQYKKILRKDIEIFLEAKQKLGEDVENVRKNFSLHIELNEEEQKELAGIAEEQKKNYRQLELEVGKIKALLEQNSVYLENFLAMKKLRVIKYRQLIQNILYFIGLKKSQVNEKNRTTLNWREVRQKWVNEGTWKKILSYVWSGPKKGQYPQYGRTPILIEAIEKLDEEEIFKYSVSFGSILILMKKFLELRDLDVEIRREKIEVERKSREKILEDNQKINKKLVQDLEKVKAGLAGQALSAFSEATWTKQFYEKNPLQEVPAEPVDDVDNDM